MTTLLRNTAAAILILGTAAFAFAPRVRYEEGVVVVKFKEPLNLKKTVNGIRTQHPEINKLNERYNVYEIEEIFDFLPEEPKNDPHGKWEWRHWLEIMEKQRYDTYYLLSYSVKEDAKKVAAAYEKEAVVDFAEPNYYGELCKYPNDPDINPQYLLDLQWNFDNFGQAGYPDVDIDCPEAWDYWPLPWYMPDPWVAVLDTGIPIDDEGFLCNIDLVFNINWDIMWDLVEGDPYPDDIAGHGSHAAGIIAADTDNGYHVAGAVWNKALVCPIKIAESQGADFSTADMAIAMLWAALQGADVENLSFGTYADESLLLKKAAEGVYAMGVTMVPARGNGASTELFFPASYPECIAVSALNCFNQLANFSNYGWDTECTAPGAAVWSTWSILAPPPYDPCKYNSSTSVAAAHVSAVCGIIVAASPIAYDPPAGLIEQWVRPILHASCDDIGPPGPDQYFGYGRLNLKNACDLAFGDSAGGGLSEKYVHGAGDKVTKPSEAAAFKFEKLTHLSCAPNPAARAVNITGGLNDCPENGEVTFDIFDLSGRRIRTLRTQALAGSYALTWDLTGSEGTRVPPGVYVMTMTAGKERGVRKIVVAY
jgi:thermitase